LAYRFEFDSTQRIMRCRLAMSVTDEEMMECYRTMALVCDALTPEAGIADFSEVTSFVTIGTVRALAKLPPAMPEPNRPRFVVAPSDHVYGLARLFQIEGEATRPNLHVVRSAEEALSMAGIDDLEFAPLSKALESLGVPKGTWEMRE